MKLRSYNLIVGASEYGKSWFVKKQLLKEKRPVLYLNWIGDKNDWTGYTKVDSRTPKRIINERIKQNKKLVYFMDEKTDNKVKEVFSLYDLIKDNMKIILVLDEVHLMAMEKELRKWLIQLATSGRHHTGSIIYLTQSMSIIPNIIFTQSQRFWFFNQKLETAYYRRQHIDYQKEIGSKLKGRLYHFVEYDGFKFSNAKVS